MSSAACDSRSLGTMRPGVLSALERTVKSCIEALLVSRAMGRFLPLFWTEGNLTIYNMKIKIKQLNRPDVNLACPVGS
jgi:hypothetical protein